VEVEDDGSIHGEQAVEVAVRQAVGMFILGRHAEQIVHVDKADFKVREMRSEQGRGRQSLFGGNVATAYHHHVRLDSLIVARPFPDPQALGAMLDGGVHVQVLQVILLVADDDINIVMAAQAVIGGGQQAVDIRRQVDASDMGILVHHHVQESGILVGEAVVVLAPHGGGDE
jgi:hypothetical protein